MKKLFVGNLDFRVDEHTLRQLFEQYGSVEGVSLVTERDTGRSRGFAFVELTNPLEADKAIAELNGSQVDGRTLAVSEARPRPDYGRKPSGAERGRQRRTGNDRW